MSPFQFNSSNIFKGSKNHSTQWHGHNTAPTLREISFIIQPVWSDSVDDVKGCVDLSEEPIKTQDFYGPLKAPTFKPKSFRNLSKHPPYLSFIIIYAFQLLKNGNQRFYPDFFSDIFLGIDRSWHQKRPRSPPQTAQSCRSFVGFVEARDIPLGFSSPSRIITSAAMASWEPPWMGFLHVKPWAPSPIVISGK